MGKVSVERLQHRTTVIELIHLYNPMARNALDDRMLNSLEQILQNLTYNLSASAIVITGSGNKAFSVGVAAFAEKTEFPLLSIRAHLQRIIQQIKTSPIPTVAAINGYALAEGMELAQACTYRISSEEATLSILPGMEKSDEMLDQDSFSQDLDVMTQDWRTIPKLVTATEAVKLHLIDQVVPPAMLEAVVLQWASQLGQRRTLPVMSDHE
ncbi:MAG: enoyl-CoA hydratase/isomerase family protein [Firmicutes bacterium]|jgi:enoyl-CoA hydratase/carnithine racemase|nr:enoyl-CoA hydratase/isomerase family protein [Bacillota bacterium]